MKNFTSISDVQDVQELTKLGLGIKKDPRAFQKIGQGKTLGLLFFNASLRTRLSTQKAAQNLGLEVIIMNIGHDGWQLEFEEGAIMNGGSQEHIKDAVMVISQYCDLIGVRSFAQLKDRTWDYEETILNAFIEHSKVPIISLESATLHPLQSLADLMTIQEFSLKKQPKIVLSWSPHPRALPQAVANSFCEWILASGHQLTITHPPGMELKETFTKGATIDYNQQNAFKDADFIYSKNWSSYHQYGKIQSNSEDWIITKEKMALTDKAYFMHCLPIRRNVIATDEVIDSEKSLILQQANNRTFAAQAVLKKIVENV